MKRSIRNKIGILTLGAALMLPPSHAAETFSSTNDHTAATDSLKQETASKNFPRTAVKLNAAIFAGVINPAVEFRIAKHFTVQLETMGCFQQNGFLWTDIPVTLATAWLEAHYYPKEAFSGFFVGPNFGYGVYRMSKGIAPGYWGSYPDSYQVGNNVMIGATIGYAFRIGSHWGIELSWGAGWQLSFYEGHIMTDDPETNGDMYVGWNKSGEWLPAYKAAINVVYRW